MQGLGNSFCSVFWGEFDQRVIVQTATPRVAVHTWLCDAMFLRWKRTQTRNAKQSARCQKQRALEP
jgi:hypothetical protein